MKMPSPEVSKRILGTVAAGLTILAFYGVLDSETVPLWLTLAAQLLGVGVAAAMPVGKPAEAPADES